jgi:Hint domain
VADTAYTFMFDSEVTEGVPVTETGTMSGNFVVDYSTGGATGSFTYDTPETGQVTDNFSEFNFQQIYVGGDIHFTDSAGTRVEVNWSGQTPTTLFEIQLDIPTGVYEASDVPVTVTVAAACFVSGARIRTTRGETAVENLAIGDLAVTASGEARPIRWLGHRTIDCTAHPRPETVWPIRIATDALAPGLPCRDLWLSPGHSVLIGDRLVQASRLVNGATVVQTPRDTVTYWHVELDSHDILIAEGAAAESYLDCGNRAAFANGGVFMELHPDFEPKIWRETCAPLIEDGPELSAIRQDLWRRAEVLGYARDQNPDLHVMADGERIDAFDLGPQRFGFVIPTTCRSVLLASRTWVPSEANEGGDPRTLGVCIGRLQIDGADVALDRFDAQGLDEGWSRLELHSMRQQRWTTGAVQLPVGARIIIVDVVGVGLYLGHSPRPTRRAAVS